ncbi:MAG: hypothetical protein LAO79_23385 [Acidobacteriia bacterium]|nr:hypothetical protein [Terriglobia bacterium]
MTRIFLLACFLAGLTAAQDDAWKPFQFLIGDWVGEGNGGPGEGTGGFSLSFDLERNILVRKNFAVYPDARHEDLMIVYLDGPSKTPRAIYFDTEGHVIRYSVDAKADALIFESEKSEPGPHYRLTYVPAGDRVKGKFEMRAPGEERYKTYLDFSARRK